MVNLVMPMGDMVENLICLTSSDFTDIKVETQFGIVQVVRR